MTFHPFSPGGFSASEPITTPAGGEAPFARIYATGTNALTTGDFMFGTFRAQTTATIGNILTCTAGTAATLATYAAVGVYSVDGSGNLTQVATTGDLHATLWIATFTGYKSAFTSTFTKQAGQVYAVGALIVTAGVVPVLYGQAPQAVFSSFAGTNYLPMAAGAVTGQTTLQSSYAIGSIVNFPGFLAASLLLP
jgi:hypothetical protein